MEAPAYGRWLGNYFRWHSGLVCVVQEMYPTGYIVTIEPMRAYPWNCQPATQQQFDDALAKALALLTANTPQDAH